MAIYFPDEGALFLQHTRKNLERLREYAPGGETFPFLVTEITVVALALPQTWFDQKTFDYAALREAAGKSWRVIDALQFANKTGRISEISSGGSVSSIGSGTKPPVLPSGVPSSVGRVETVIDPSGTLIDVTASFLHRSPDGQELRYEGSVTLKDGYPQVLQVVSAGKKTNDDRLSGRAIILRSTITGAGPQAPADQKSAK